MLSSDDDTSHINQSSHTAQATEALARLPHSLERRSLAGGRKRDALQQKDTEALPSVNAETAHTKVAWRQVIQLREENRRLHSQLEQQQAEMHQLVTAYNALQVQLDQDVTSMHDDYLQEKEQYHTHLQAAVAERDRLQTAHVELEGRYQALFHSFQDAVEREAQKLLADAAQTVEQSPDKVPAVFKNVMKTLEMQVRQEEEKHLVEALYLKREVQRMAALLEQEHQQITEERQHLLTMQNTAREQARLRHKTLQARLRSRWRLYSITVTIGMVLLLVTLQFLFLNLAHIKIAAQISFLLLLPIIICSVVSIALSGPLIQAQESGGVAKGQSKKK